MTQLNNQRIEHDSFSNLTGWQNLTLEDLVAAYRKTKADNFFENTFPTAIKIPWSK